MSSKKKNTVLIKTYETSPTMGCSFLPFFKKNSPKEMMLVNEKTFKKFLKENKKDVEVVKKVCSEKKEQVNSKYLVVFLLLFLLLFSLFTTIVTWTMLTSLLQNTKTVERKTQRIQINEPLLSRYSFEYELKSVKYPVGCEYWNGYIDELKIENDEKTWLKRMVYCESTCNPYAVSPAGASGLFQFMPRTFAHYGAGLDYGNPYDQLDTALKMYKMGQAHQWCCN